MPEPAAIQKIFVGIDFGTTFSSVSCICLRGGTLTSFIDNYMSVPSDPLLQRPQVPTVFTFDQTGKIILRRSPPGPSDIRWCKLALVHRDHLPRDLQPLFEEARVSWGTRSAADMIAPFLRALMQRFFEDLQGRLRLPGPCDFHCVFAFPASWKPEDCNRMRAAVEKACLPSLADTSTFSFDYLSEQEAVALAVCNDEGSFAEDSLITVCDCGGLTLDIASYILTLKDGAPQMVQCGEARSVASGGIILHREVENLVKVELERRTGNSRFLETCGDAQSKQIRAACIKMIHESDGLGKGNVRITFHLGIDRAAITVKRAEMNKMFDELVEAILTAANTDMLAAENTYRDLMGKEVLKHYLALTGGLSCNGYIRRAIHDKVQQQHGNKIELILPPGNSGWTAVGRGGAIHALHSTLTRREGFGVAWRTCPATFYIRERLEAPIILARKGQLLQTNQENLCDVPLEAVRCFLGKCQLVVHRSSEDGDSNYVTFSWDARALNGTLSLSFFSSGEPGLSIDLRHNGMHIAADVVQKSRG
ncbi:hypothetical protein QBC34DRAFT_443876 [Podospora aff. communis PSN243]|uniref:Uncharacterized protein n=1 Tax=Podospora aff. communis PSN243 TaxID=3040156 RepID=A0AAV9G4S2_9PEZI|nr:hypothetical protein QBC34DRAFT_443876 [Podospora aff. communis PSN243]